MFLLWTLTAPTRCGLSALRAAGIRRRIACRVLPVRSRVTGMSPPTVVGGLLQVCLSGHGIGVILYYFVAFGPPAPSRVEPAGRIAARSRDARGTDEHRRRPDRLEPVARRLRAGGNTTRAWRRSVRPASLGTFIGMGVVLALCILVWNGPATASAARRRDGRRRAARPVLHLYARPDPRNHRRPHLSSCSADRVPGSSRFVLLATQDRRRSSASGAGSRARRVYQDRITKANTVQIRVELQRWSLKLAAERPLFGWGYGSFDRVVRRGRSEPRQSPAQRRSVQHQSQHVPDDPRRIRIDRARVVRLTLARDRLAGAWRRTAISGCPLVAARGGRRVWRLRVCGAARSTSGSSRSSRPFPGSSSDFCVVCNALRAGPSPCSVVMVADYPALGAEPVGGPQSPRHALFRRLPASVSRHGCDPVLRTARARFLSNSENASSSSSSRPTDRWSLLTGLRAFRRRVRLVIERLDADLVHAQELVPYGIAGTEAPSLPRDPDRARQHAGGHARRDARGRRHLDGHTFVTGSPEAPSNEQTSSSESTRAGRSTCPADRGGSSTSRTSSTSASTRLTGRPSPDSFSSWAGRGRSRAGRCSRPHGPPCAPQAPEAHLLVAGWSSD